MKKPLFIMYIIVLQIAFIYNYLEYIKKIGEYDALMEFMYINIARKENNKYNHFEAMTNIHKKKEGNIRDDSVLFFGDSLTESFCLSCFFHNGVNYGIGGDTTSGLLKRLPEYKSISTAKGVSISIGINDLRGIKSDNYNKLIKNYTDIIELIPSNKKILLNSINPVDSNKLSGYQDDIKLTISNINKDIEMLCNDRENCYFLNTAQYLADINGNLREKYHIGDGLHLSSSGYQIWGDLIAEAIKDWQ